MAGGANNESTACVILNPREESRLVTLNLKSRGEIPLWLGMTEL